MSDRHRPSLLLAVAVLIPLLVGCQLGERPSFNTDPFAAGTLTGDVAVDQVLQSLDQAPQGPLTAGYSVLVRFGMLDTSGSVALSGDSRLVSLGNAQWRETPGFSETCYLDKSKPCVDGLSAEAASDTTLTIDFYGADAARRLRRDAQSKIGPAVASTQNFDGQTATCVEVPLSGDSATNGGSSKYCVLPNGLMALRSDGSVEVTLALYTDSVDQAVFEPGV